MREVDRAELWRARTGPLRERDEVEDAREDLRREVRDWDEHVAAREHRKDETLRSAEVLVDCRKGCRTCLGLLDGGLELIQLALEAGKHV